MIRVNVLCLLQCCVFYVLQKQNKYSENKLKALKSRNDYLLCIESANAGVSKYFADDISDLIDVRDITLFKII